MTNEAALRVHAEAANGIIGTGQVYSAGGNSTPPNGTVGWGGGGGGGKGVSRPVCVCVFVKRMKVIS